MAYEVGNQAISVPASADLSAKQFLFGTIGATGVAVTGAGLAADGVIGGQARCGGSSVRALHDARAGRQGDVRRGGRQRRAARSGRRGKAMTQAAGKILAKALAAGAGDGVIIPALLILQR